MRASRDDSLESRIAVLKEEIGPKSKELLALYRERRRRAVKKKERRLKKAAKALPGILCEKARASRWRQHQVLVPEYERVETPQRLTAAFKLAVFDLRALQEVDLDIPVPVLTSDTAEVWKALRRDLCARETV